MKRQATKTHLSWRHVGTQRDRLGNCGQAEKEKKEKLEGKKTKRNPSELDFYSSG